MPFRGAPPLRRLPACRPCRRGAAMSAPLLTDYTCHPRQQPLPAAAVPCCRHAADIRDGGALMLLMRARRYYVTRYHAMFLRDYADAVTRHGLMPPSEERRHRVYAIAIASANAPFAGAAGADAGLFI